MRLQIGGHTVRVVRKDVAARGVNGECSYDGLTITLDRSLRGSRLVEVLLHEVVHMVADASALDLTEQQVRILGFGLQQMLVDLMPVSDVEAALGISGSAE